MRFQNVWDQVLALTGSVYGNPTYISGPETGQTIYDAPATKYYTAGQGAVARHNNYALRQNGENAIQAAQHVAMCFRGAGTWTPLCGASSPTNDGFLVGSTGTATFHRDGVLSHAFTVINAAVGAITLVHDDGFHVIAAERNAGGEVSFASASTVSHTAGFVGGTFPLAAVTVFGHTLVMTTSGTAIQSWTFPSSSSAPAISSLATSGGLNSSSTSIWDSVRSPAAATATNNPAILYAKGLTSASKIVVTPDGQNVSAAVTLTGPHDTLADIGFDDVQGLFVACFYSSTGSALGFQTSPDGVTWTTSTTAVGPASNPFVTGSPTQLNTVAFKIASGVWFAASTNFQPPNFVSGLLAPLASDGLRVFGFYSLDFGVTWYPADLDMATCTTPQSLRIKTLDRKFMVLHDSDVSVSGPVGIPTVL